MMVMRKIRGAVGGWSWGMMNCILASLVLAVCLLAMPQGAWGDADNTWNGTGGNTI